MSMNRRRFISQSIGGIAALGIPAGILSGVVLPPTAGPDGMPDLNWYLQHFGVSKEQIARVMETALARGGDYCDLFFQHAVAHYVALEDKQVNQAYSSVDFGVGVRVLKGDQTGFSFTEVITPEAMAQAARAAAAIASGNRNRQVGPFRARPTPPLYPLKKTWEAVPIGDKIPLLSTLGDRVIAIDPHVIKANVDFSDESSYILLATSDGLMACDFQPMSTLSVRCTAEKDSRRETNYASHAGRFGIEEYTPALLEAKAQEAVRKTMILFDAVQPKGGELPVILAPGGSGILLHEAIGHGMEADFNRKGTSIFSDKIGRQVAAPFVTILDDGTVPHLRGSIAFDDEGTDSQRTVLVENGIMKSYLHDRLSAAFYKLPSTGNGRRQSFRFAPVPRMRTTCMLAGPHTPEEIIRSVDYGIYAESFTNGQVNIGAGDFTFYVKLGYLVEGGKRTRPIKDINIIGNGFQVLSRITMVGNDFAYDMGTWTCGKDGQGVPVSMGLPTVKVSALTVGGTNG